MTANRQSNHQPQTRGSWPRRSPGLFAAALAAGADRHLLRHGQLQRPPQGHQLYRRGLLSKPAAPHLAGSRVYVTVNIVIKQSEMGDALQLIHRCSTLGADAFIIRTGVCSLRSSAPCPAHRDAYLDPSEHP